MVYKRYIEKGGKKYGPYYYESFRDKKGVPRTKIVDSPKKTPPEMSFSLIIFLLIGLSLFLIVGTSLVVKSNTQDGQEISSFNSFLIEVKSFGQIITNTVGRIVEPIPEDTPAEESAPEEISEEIAGEIETEEEIAGESVEEGTEVIEELVEEETEIIEETVEKGKSEENKNESLDKKPEETGLEKANVTKEKGNDETKIPEANIAIEENQTNATIESGNYTNITLESDGILQNVIIENESFGKINFTTEISTIHYGVRLGEPVRWKKNIVLEIDPGKNLSKLTIELPILAGNISIKKIDFDTNEEIEIEARIRNEKIIEEINPTITITGNVLSSEKTGFSKRILKFFQSFFSLVGRVVEPNPNQEVIVDIREKLENQDEIEIEYYTDAPYAEEIEINENHKKITIVGQEELHYENVLAFSDLPNEIESIESINLYHLVDGNRESSNFEVYDLDENGLYDHIEWIVPQLSNQTYEIILITNAIHLDENRSFISNIYEEVKELDGVWSEPISADEYIRVTFETNLTNLNDITVYARNNQSLNTSIEVYHYNSSEKITEFPIINETKYYKVLLTNMNRSHDTFDLKIIGSGYLEFDHIIDPFTGGGDGSAGDPFQITNCTQLQEMQDNLTASYLLTSNIDCSDSVNFNSGAGFIPVGNTSLSFTGSLNGSDFNVTDLVVNRTGENYTGLFGYVNESATIDNIGLTDANISGDWYVGGLVGRSTDGTIINNSFVTGNVTGSRYVGGFVGLNNDTNISNSYFSGGNVTNSGSYVGGFIGWNGGNISNSYSTGNVTGSGTWTGGFIGRSVGNVSIDNSYSTMKVVGSSATGGFIGFVNCGIADGYRDCNISNSYATGNVNGGQNSGGFIGQNDGGDIYSSYATGNVTGAGGFIGKNSGNINNSNATGNVNGGTGNDIGGFLGIHTGGEYINNSFATGDVTNAGNDAGGFIGLLQAATTQINNSYATGNVFGKLGSGGFVGSNRAYLISYSYATGNVSGTFAAGGFSGDNRGNISHSYSTGNTTAAGGTGTGGFVGAHDQLGGKKIFINNSYSTGSAKGADDVGGFAGTSKENISYSYATGNATGGDDIGGFIGEKTGAGRVYDSFSAGNVSGTGSVGGFIGNGGDVALTSYWDNGTVGGDYSDTSAGDTDNITEQNTSQMTKQASYINWDFTNTWKINETYSYPCLLWQDDAGCVGVKTSPSTITLPEYTNATSRENTDLLTLNVLVTYSEGLTGATCLIDVNGTNQSVSMVSGWCNSSSISLTNLANGNQTIKVWANNTHSNFGLNDSYVVSISTTSKPPPGTPTGGGGGDPDLKKKEYTTDVDSMVVVLYQGENKSEDLTIANTGDLALSLSLVLKNLGNFASLKDNSISLPVGGFVTTQVLFSTSEKDVPGLYPGSLEISSPLKVINISLQILEKKKGGGLCGNGIIDLGEQCDGIINDKSCGDFGFKGGNLTCTGCQFNTSICIGGDFSEGSFYCGNGVLEPGEQCDGEVIDQVCSGFGNFDEGLLSCTKTCKIDTHLCFEYSEKPKGDKGLLGIPFTIKDAVNFLWVFLLLLLIYLIVRKYIRIRNQLAGYKSREERVAAVNRLKRSARKSNFFERNIDGVAIALSRKG